MFAWMTELPYRGIGKVAVSPWHWGRKCAEKGTVLNSREALNLLPPDAVNQLAVTHNQIGILQFEVGNLEQAMRHCRESIRYKEVSGNHYGAGVTRFNIAMALVRKGRLNDALIYAREALANHEPYGAGAAADIEKARSLIADIERAQAEGASG
jgi:tetratricopeptide (TPR) repeat protein